MIAYVIWVALMALFIGWPAFMLIGAVYDAVQLWRNR